jgi:hypothetical protein
VATSGSSRSVAGSIDGRDAAMSSLARATLALQVPLASNPYDIAPSRIVEIEPAHDREAVGVFAHRRLRQLVRIRVPQHRMDQRPVDTGLVHVCNRLFG